MPDQIIPPGVWTTAPGTGLELYIFGVDSNTPLTIQRDIDADVAESDQKVKVAAHLDNGVTFAVRCPAWLFNLTRSDYAIKDAPTGDQDRPMPREMWISVGVYGDTIEEIELAALDLVRTNYGTGPQLALDRPHEIERVHPDGDRAAEANGKAFFGKLTVHYVQGSDDGR